MEALYSLQQLANLQSKLWWVACNQTPFLIKCSSYDNALLLSITDLRTLWGTRLDQKKLMKDKQIYAKTLQVTNAKELVTLFQGILANPEQKALYKFIRKNNGDLIFQIQKQIEVYPLTWKFQLIQLDCDMVKMMCKDIINPLVRTLNAQEKRIEIMRRKMKILEENMLKRMTQTEKVYYKSVLLEDQQDLKLLVREPKEEQFISDLQFENRSKFFFERSLTGFKNLRNALNQKSTQKQKEGTTKVQKKMITGLTSQLNAQEILNQLQMKKQDERDKKKKKRNIDFI